MRNRGWNRPIMRALMAACAAGVLAVAGHAHAQGLSLPKVDSVNFFLQAGSLVGSHDLVDDPSANEKTFGELGWGFETLFDMAEVGNWSIELAVGYDQMFLRSKFANEYSVRGTIKNWPSSSIYASHENGLYLGFGTGAVSLSNVFAFNEGRRAFSISGDTFDLTARLGFVKSLSDGGGKGPSTNLFFELAYHARFLGNAAYGTGAPDTLPGSLYFGGIVLSVGAQVSLKANSSFDEDVKKEAKRLKLEVAHPAPNELMMTTACSNEPVKANHVPIDDYWDPTRCGLPDTVSANVRVLADLSQIGAGSTVDVCRDATLPSGWKQVSERWDPTRCGRPQTPEMNVRRIRNEDP